MKTKVLMVCLGNICRSPLAEGILKNKVNPANVMVDSAGTASYHIGKSPDSRSIAVAKKYGIDIRQQVCRKFNIRDFEDFDLIYAMDKGNYDTIVQMSNSAEQATKVRLLLSAIDGSEKEVPDPYYGGEDGFEHVFKMVDVACEHIVKRL